MQSMSVLICVFISVNPLLQSMNKLKFILPILLLTILVLIGGSCGKDENGDVNLGNVNLNKELSESEIRYVLNKTADDLGWTGYEISGREGW